MGRPNCLRSAVAAANADGGSTTPHTAGVDIEPEMALEEQLMDDLYGAMRAGRRVRVRLDDGRSGRRSARSFVGIPTSIGPWGAVGEPHVVLQMRGVHGTMIAVAVQLDRVVAVDLDVA